MPIIKVETKPAVKVFQKDSSGKKVYYSTGSRKGEPKMKIKTPAKHKTELNVQQLYSIFKRTDIIVIERQNPRPGNSAGSSFTTGINYGKLLALAELSGAKIELVAPGVWKKYYELDMTPTEKKKLTNTEYKKLSLNQAERLTGYKTSSDGIADAICIGMYWITNKYKG